MYKYLNLSRDIKSIITKYLQRTPYELYEIKQFNWIFIKSLEYFNDRYVYYNQKYFNPSDFKSKIVNNLFDNIGDNFCEEWYEKSGFFELCQSKDCLNGTENICFCDEFYCDRCMIKCECDVKMCKKCFIRLDYMWDSCYECEKIKCENCVSNWNICDECENIFCNDCVKNGEYNIDKNKWCCKKCMNL